MKDVFPRYQNHLATRRARTIAVYLSIARAFFAFLRDRVPLRDDVEAFLVRDRPHGPASPATRNLELVGCRVLATFMLREGVWPRDPTEGLKKQRTPRKRPTVLGLGEVRALFELAALRSEPLRSRDLAIVAVLSQTGLRVNELCELNLDQFDRCSSQLVHVVGKGGTVHDVILNDATRLLVGRWLDVRPAVAIDIEPALFVNASGHRLRPRAIQRLFVAWRAKLGTAKKISPHTLRHTMGTLAYANGADIALVGNLLRHSDVNTTMIYIHCVDDGRRAAVARLQTTVPSHLIAVQSGEIAPGTITSHILQSPVANTVDAQAQLSGMGGSNIAA